MNERIEQLASQLGPIATIGNWGRVEWADNVYPQLGDKLYAAIDLEKFAELIVRECVQTLIDNTPERYTNESAEEDWDKGYDRAMKDCVQYIQEHFGVEE